VVSALALAEGLHPDSQRIRPLSDPIWVDLDALLHDSGRVPLTWTLPFSDARILAEIADIDPSVLSGPGQAARIRILAALSEGHRIFSGPLGATPGVRLTPEIAWRSDRNLPWVKGYADRPPLIGLPLELGFADSVYGFSELAIAMDPTMISAMPGGGLGLNLAEIAAAPIGIDATFPFRSFGSVGGSWWNFQIGRDRISMGSAGNYNLTLSSAAEFLDFARLSLFSPGFGWTGLVIQLNPQRNLYVHRFDIRLGGTVSIGFIEETLVGVAPLELRYLNPLMVFHGFQSWSDYQWLPATTYKDGASNQVGLSLDWSPLRWFEVSAQYAMNQISDPLKMIFWPSEVSQIPDGEAWLARFSLRWPLEEFFAVINLVGAYTTPFAWLSTGNAGTAGPSGIAESPITWIYDRPTKSNYVAGDDRSRSWLGFSEGPDTILASASMGIDGAGAWSCLADVTWKAQGEKSSPNSVSLQSWAAYDADPSFSRLRTPSGTPEYSLRSGVTVRIAPIFISPPLSVGLDGGIHWTGRWNAAHATGIFDQSWEIDASVALALR
jgi:hypothetical protein